ncbi:MAG: hypothetical protein ACREUU_03135 [Gammaproteobacteria bacterium]
MYSKLERNLIVAVIVIAVLYALLSLWPENKAVVEQPVPAAGTAAEEPPAKSEAKSRAGEVIANLIHIGSAELSFHGIRKRFGTMEELAQERLLNAKFSQGAVIDGYQYVVRARGQAFAAHANPAEGRGGRHYYIDQSLDLRYDDNGRASGASPYLSYSKRQPPDKP